jgi:hypothetical protein
MTLQTKKRRDPASHQCDYCFSSYILSHSVKCWIKDYFLMRLSLVKDSEQFKDQQLAGRKVRDILTISS